MTRQGPVSASVYIKHTFAPSVTNTHTKSQPLGKMAPFAIKPKHIVDTLTSDPHKDISVKVFSCGLLRKRLLC